MSLVCEYCRGIGSIEHPIPLYSSGGKVCSACNGTGLHPAAVKQLEVCDKAAESIGEKLTERMSAIEKETPVAFIERLESTIERLREERDEARQALVAAKKIIEMYVPMDALGDVENGDEGWPLLAEYLSNFERITQFENKELVELVKEAKCPGPGGQDCDWCKRAFAAIQQHAGGEG